METNYQKFLSGEYCNRLDKEVFDMIVRNKRLLAEFNMNCTFLDNNYITIGNNVLIAPNVQLYTATHPVSASERFVEDWDENSGELFFRTRALPITIGNDVWIGGGVIVLPGVTIGDNCVIGAGSVVTRSIPSNSLAVGNPCQVVKTI